MLYNLGPAVGPVILFNLFRYVTFRSGGLHHAPGVSLVLGRR